MVAFDEYKDNGDADIPSVEELLQLFEQSLLLIGQTNNLVMHKRRRNALSCIYHPSQVTSTLKEKAEFLRQKKKLFTRRLLKQ